MLDVAEGQGREPKVRGGEEQRVVEEQPCRGAMGRAWLKGRA